MKRKKIQIDESMLIPNNEQQYVRGGDTCRTRYKFDDGTKIKIVSHCE